MARRFKRILLFDSGVSIHADLQSSILGRLCGRCLSIPDFRSFDTASALSDRRIRQTRPESVTDHLHRNRLVQSGRNLVQRTGLHALPLITAPPPAEQ